jgi:hypothetical protein
MGEAKRRKIMGQQLPPLAVKSVEAVARALQKLTASASENHGYDCYLHTFIGRHLLNKLGIKTNLVVGFAAWRVGSRMGQLLPTYRM